MIYSIFGLKEGASLEEVKRAYREKMNESGNDKNMVDKLNKSYMQIVQMIQDENRKKTGTMYRYDRNYNYRQRRTGYRGCVRSCCCGCCDSECCDCLTDLWCADSLCECMGGDLCECM